MLRLGAPAYALVATHPDGTGPSVADQAVSRRLVAAGVVCGVRLHASLVLTRTDVHDRLPRHHAEPLAEAG